MTAYRPKSRRRKVWRPVAERTITINGPSAATNADVETHGFSIEIARPDGSRVRVDPATMVGRPYFVPGLPDEAYLVRVDAPYESEEPPSALPSSPPKAP